MGGHLRHSPVSYGTIQRGMDTPQREMIHELDDPNGTVVIHLLALRSSCCSLLRSIVFAKYDRFQFPGKNDWDVNKVIRLNGMKGRVARPSSNI